LPLDSPVGLLVPPLFAELLTGEEPEELKVNRPLRMVRA